MRNNPFTSDTYTSTWLKHYEASNKTIEIDGIEGVSFVKSNFPNLYFNVGKNLTKGISYFLNKKKTSFSLGHKAFLLYDIPGYLNIQTLDKPEGLRIKKIKQYQGYMADLSAYDTIDSYLKSKFSSKSQYKYRRNIKRLEKCFNIEYAVHHGAIEKSKYDYVFEVFTKLLKKRFSQKQETYDQLSHWSFYRELIYKMILEKKASFFVIYESGVPISIMLNFHSDEILFDAIPVFDTDFSKFTIGHIAIIKTLEWCINSGIKMFDFSKGHYDYKEKWGNKSYDFEYHILYNPKSILSSTTAFLVSKYFKWKQYLREQDINLLFHKILFFFTAKDKQKSQLKGIEVNEFKELPKKQIFTEIKMEDIDDSLVKKKIYEYLFNSKEHKDEIKLFKSGTIENEYIIEGKIKKLQIEYS
ncbi:GNAT family N-acetyltransferase [Flavobacteriaceae bacterium R38]|nr:GNAT family N-acetyltransferase [Flavobacteriaceae bacterium R38]